MKTILFYLIALVTVASCTNSKKEKEVAKEDTYISLHSDTINVVKMTDTLVIYESTCRGCKYEQSTHFDISDSMGIIKLYDVKTTDNNSPDMAGGNVSKTLILVPTKTGSTIFKLYKFWEQTETAKDSANPVSYQIEVKN